MKRASVIAVSAIWLSGMGLVVVGEMRQAGRGGPGDILAKVETTVVGWDATSLPLGETPEQSETVLKTLQCDSTLNIRYVKGEDRIDVYAAYWKAGKAPVHMVARHTPDSCWVASGWKCVEKRSLLRAPVGQNGTLGAGEYRIFTADQRREHVYFVHFIDGAPSSLREDDRGLGPIAKWVSELFRKELLFWAIGRGENTTSNTSSGVENPGLFAGASEMLNQRKEQLFVRISSNQPIEESWAEPVVGHFFRQLPLRAPTRTLSNP